MSEKDSYSPVKKKIIAVLDNLLEGEQWNNSFFLKAMHGRFATLRKKLHQDFGLAEVPANAAAQTDPAQPQDGPHAAGYLVYARIYHKDLEKVAEPQPPIPWLKTLLESIKNNEKLGIAVYADEHDVRQSIRGSRYGYVKVLIRQPTQDVTEKRSPKKDPNLGCNLLIIEDIQSEDLLTLVHNDVEYDLQSGYLVKW